MKAVTFWRWILLAGWVGGIGEYGNGSYKQIGKMTDSIEEKTLSLIEDSLKEFESSKGSLDSAIKKLKRAAELSEHKDIVAWCNLQLGNPECINLAKGYVKSINDYNLDKSEEKLLAIASQLKKLKNLGFKFDDTSSLGEMDVEINQKVNTSSGGFEGIGFIEEKYSDLVRTKRGNDGVYYKTNLNSHLNLIRSNGHKKATYLYNKIAFKDAPKTSFDYLKVVVDNRLLDLNPELAEQLMVAFKSAVSNNKEELSHSLTTCRRVIERFADIVFPPREELFKGRKVGKPQYINRIWAFIDIAIDSNSNKALSHSHLEFLGNYLESIHKATNKGVHSDITQIESVKTIFHLYLLFADLLDFLDIEIQKPKNGKIDINKASIDELEALGKLKRKTAKEIIISRVKNGKLTEKLLIAIPGVGPKTLKTLKEYFQI
ncbi:MAG: helix-hairpin-helix domain-containing protein [Saprospiraceae bacterium]|nr:helix-hairpin-helix domain-containing protein [Saprospiraceae bacterium]